MLRTCKHIISTITQAGSSRLAYPTAYLTPPFECLTCISNLICIKLASDIISKCQNLLLLQTSLSQGMAALIFQLFSLEILAISLTPLFLSHTAFIPSGNPAGSTFKLCPKSATSHSLFYLFGLHHYYLFLRWTQ